MPHPPFNSPAGLSPDEEKALRKIGRRAARTVGRAAAGTAKLGTGVIVDSLGRRWDSNLHPRDSRGRFIETGGTAKVWGGRVGKVVRALGNGYVQVQMPDGTRERVKGNRLTMVARPDGSAPTADRGKVIEADTRRERDPRRGDGRDSDDLGGDDAPDPSDDNDSEPARRRRAQAAPAKTPGARPRRFATVDAVKEHWRDSPDRDDADTPAMQERFEGAARRNADRVTSAQLSKDGSFVIGRDPRGWGVFHSGTGLTVRGGKSQGIDTRKAALALTAELEGMQVGEEVFDWDAPNLRSRMDDGFKDALSSAASRAGDRITADKQAAAARKAGAPGGPDVPESGPSRADRERIVGGFTDEQLAEQSTRAGNTPETRELIAAEQDRRAGDAGGTAPAADPEAVPAVDAEEYSFQNRPLTPRDPLIRGDADPGAGGIAAQRLREAEAEARRDWADFQERFGSDARERAATHSRRLRGQARQNEATGDAPGAARFMRRSEALDRILAGDASAGATRPQAAPDDAAGDAPPVNERLAQRAFDQLLTDNGGDRRLAARDLRRRAEQARGGGGAASQQSAAAMDAVADREDRRAADAEPPRDAPQTPTATDTIPDQPGPSFEERIAALTGYEEMGPGYNRGVAENLGRARRQKAKGDDAGAEVWLREAETSVSPAPAGYDDARSEGVGDGPPRDGRDVLADVPAEPVRLDPPRAAGGVLPRPEQPGQGAGGVRGERGQARGGAAGRRDVPGDAGRPPAGEGLGAGDRTGRPGVPAAGAGDGGPEAGGVRPARVGRRKRTDPVGDRPSEGRARRFRPRGQDDLAPKRGKLEANLAALRLLRDLDAQDRQATPDEQRVIARWAGWGSLPDVFDEGKPALATERAELKELLTPDEYREARANTKNAHYTDAALVDEVWAAVRDLGFTGGDVLEPGSGSGNFIGRAPDGARMTGVELDPTTAAISRHLYPDADIFNESFGKSPFRESVFDAVVGNVPFGNYPVIDKTYNPGNALSIHDHFILKSLATTKPGGVVAVITSAFSLDKMSPEGRRRIAGYGDLLGAVRLPSGTHKDAAGTDVVTDVLVFRRRKDTDAPADRSWLTASPALHPDGTPVLGITQGDRPPKQLSINDYFRDNPDNVLGTIVDGGYNGVAVKADGDTTTRLRKALAEITAKATAAGRGFNPDTPDVVAPAKRNVGAGRDGRISYVGEVGDGKQRGHRFEVVEDGHAVTLDVPATQQEELRDLLGLRDAADELIEVEVEHDDRNPAVAAARKRLNRLYDEYVSKPGRGPVTRYTEDKGTRRKPPVMRFVMRDEGAAALFGLEHGFDAGTGKAKKADLFHTRQVDRGRSVPDRADTPQDALALAAERGETADAATVARLLGMPEDQVGPYLTGMGLAYIDPDGDGSFVPADMYLSGNVRKKLARAREAAAADPKLEPNVRALEAIQPVEATIEDVPKQLGAPWMGTDVVREFAKSLVRSDVEVNYSPEDGWKVPTPPARGRMRGAEEEWGTPDRSVYQLLESVLKQQHKVITITRKNEDGTRYTDPKASELATAAAKNIEDAWQDFIWSNSRVGDRITQRYNTNFRSIVPRVADDRARAYPGMAVGKKLRPHQNGGVNRIVTDESVLLEHVVGSGKTFTLAAGAMELRRLGLANKVALNVPNPLIAQWAAEFKELYPNARVLTVDTDSLGKGAGVRKRFAAKVRNNDWDIVLFTGESFESIPVGEASFRAYMDREVDALQRRLSKAKANGKDATVKQVEKAIAVLEASIEEQVKSRYDEGGITFEELGIDYVMVDEAHRYKNLPFATSIQGVTSPAGADRARDMHMKLGLLRDMADERGGPKRVATFATGTPISNSLAEMYTMQRLLRPDLLAEAGVEDFDAWAATFASIEKKVETDNSSTGYTERVRFRGFTDAIGDGLRLWRTFADTVTGDALEKAGYISTPGLAGGARKIHVVERTPEQDRARASFKERIDAMAARGGRPQKGDDTHVAVIGDGRAMAIDPRLMSARGRMAAGVDRDDDSTDAPKLDSAAAEIAAIWRRERDRAFKFKDTDPDDAPRSGKRGALQMAFIDSSAPKKDQYNAYTALRDRLVAQGMDPARIRFVQEVAGDSAGKARMMEAARQGDLDLIIGSTEALGTGTNAQNRLVALHHIEASWKPSDIQQREGRALRQGNQYDEVEIHAYITKGTHDEKTWDMIAYKSAGLEALQNGSYDQGAIEFADDVDPLNDYDTLAGEAADNPLAVDMRQLQSRIKELAAARRQYDRQQSRARSVVADGKREEQSLARAVDRLGRAITERVDTTGDRFAMTVRGDRYGAGAAKVVSRDAAAEALGRRLDALLEGFVPAGEYNQGFVGEIGGFNIRASTVNEQGRKPEITLGLVPVSGRPYDESLPLNPVVVTREDMAKNMRGVITRIENRLGSLERRRDELASRREHTLMEIGVAESQQGREFRQADETENARRRMVLVSTLLNENAVNDQGEAIEADARRRMRTEYEGLKESAAVLGGGRARKPSAGDVVEEPSRTGPGRAPAAPRAGAGRGAPTQSWEDRADQVTDDLAGGGVGDPQTIVDAVQRALGTSDPDVDTADIARRVTTRLDRSDLPRGADPGGIEGGTGAVQEPDEAVVTLSPDDVRADQVRMGTPVDLGEAPDRPSPAPEETPVPSETAVDAGDGIPTQDSPEVITGPGGRGARVYLHEEGGFGRQVWRAHIDGRPDPFEMSAHDTTLDGFRGAVRQEMDAGGPGEVETQPDYAVMRPQDFDADEPLSLVDERDVRARQDTRRGEDDTGTPDMFDAAGGEPNPVGEAIREDVRDTVREVVGDAIRDAFTPQGGDTGRERRGRDRDAAGAGDPAAPPAPSGGATEAGPTVRDRAPRPRRDRDRPPVDVPGEADTPTQTPPLAQEDTGPAPAAERRRDAFTPVEQATIRNAVDDHAARYFGGPAGFGRADAARYVTEGHLPDLVEERGLTAVWEAVAEEIEERPDVLDRNKSRVAQVAAEREDRARRLASEAFQATKDGDYDRASTLIDEVEAIDPGFKPSRRSLTEIRAIIAKQREVAQQEPEVAPEAPEVAPEVVDGGTADAVTPAEPPTEPVPVDPMAVVDRSLDLGALDEDELARRNEALRERIKADRANRGTPEHRELRTFHDDVAEARGQKHTARITQERQAADTADAQRRAADREAYQAHRATGVYETADGHVDARDIQPGDVVRSEYGSRAPFEVDSVRSLGPDSYAVDGVDVATGRRVESRQQATGGMSIAERRVGDRPTPILTAEPTGTGDIYPGRDVGADGPNSPEGLGVPDVTGLPTGAARWGIPPLTQGSASSQGKAPLARSLRAAARSGRDEDRAALTLAANALTGVAWNRYGGAEGQGRQLADLDINTVGMTRADVDTRIQSLADLADELDRLEYGRIRLAKAKGKEPGVSAYLRDYATAYRARRADAEPAGAPDVEPAEVETPLAPDTNVPGAGGEGTSGGETSTPPAVDTAPPAAVSDVPAPGLAGEQLEGEKFPPSEQQQTLIDAVLNGKDTVAQAKAGAGKTSTLEMLARRVARADPNRRIAYIAFNKSVQLEAEGRMPDNVEPRTGHSIAYAWAGKDFTAKLKRTDLIRRADEQARHLGVTRDLPTLGGSPMSPAEQAQAALRAVDAYANSADDEIGAQHLPERARENLGPGETAAVLAIADRMWADLRDKDGRVRTSLDHIRKMWALSRPDFTKPGSGLERPSSLLFLDEAQDTPPVLARVVADQDMQRVLVGDADQAIYGFTGAVDFLSTADRDVELPLTRSYRFGPQIAEMGNRFLSLLDSGTRVEGVGPDSRVTEAGTMDGADAILVRSNAGAIGEIVREQSAGRRVGVPKGTKADLSSLVESARYLMGSGAPPARMHDDLAAFRTWDEVVDESEKGDDPKLAMLERIVRDTGLDELDRIVQQVIEVGDGGLAGVRFSDMPHGLVADGRSYGAREHLKAAGFRWMGLPGGGLDKQGRPVKRWTATGSPGERDAKLARARESAAGESPDVMVSTAHKAKGLEWGRVRIGDDFRGPTEDRSTGEVVMPSDEELRLAYVAVTRAERELDPGSLAWVYDQGSPAAPPADAPPAGVPDAGAPAGAVGAAPDTSYAGRGRAIIGQARAAADRGVMADALPHIEDAEDAVAAGRYGDAADAMRRAADMPGRGEDSARRLRQGGLLLDAAERDENPPLDVAPATGVDVATAGWTDHGDGSHSAGMPASYVATIDTNDDGTADWIVIGQGDRDGEIESGQATSTDDAKQRVRAVLDDWGMGGAVRAVEGEDADTDAPGGGGEPEPIGGAVTEWVPTAGLTVGDVARVTGIDNHGQESVLAGHVIGPLTPVTISRRRKPSRPMYSVTIAENPDGTGSRGTVYVPRDGVAARAPQAGTAAEADDAAPSALPETQVTTGNLPERVPTDSEGRGAFPGGIVTGRDGREGIVTGVTDDTATVRWDDGENTEVTPAVIEVTDGGQARPDGWTSDGHMLRPGQIVETGDGRGTVESVDGDTARVATPGGIIDAEAEDTRVIGEVRDGPVAPEPVDVVYKPAGDLAVGDTVMLSDDDGSMFPAEVTTVDTSDTYRAVIDYRDARTGKAGVLDADRTAAFPLATSGGAPAPVRPADAADARPVDVEAARPAVIDPVDGPVTHPPLLPSQRRVVDGLGFDLDVLSDRDVAQGAARLRAGHPLGPVQSRALADAVRSAAGADGIDAARARSLRRVADALDAAAAETGQAAAPDAAGEAVPATARDLAAGDLAAVPAPDGSIVVGRVTATRSMMGGRMWQVDMDRDGTLDRRLITGASDVWRLPDTPAPEPVEPRRLAPESADTEELVHRFHVENRARETAAMVGENAAAGVVGTESIHELRERVAERLTPEATQEVDRDVARGTYDGLTGDGVEGDTRAGVLEEARRVGDETQEEVRDRVLSTVNDAEPLPGEDHADTAARVGQLITEAAVVDPQEMARRVRGDEPSVDADTPDREAVQAHVAEDVDVFTAELFGDAATAAAGDAPLTRADLDAFMARAERNAARVPPERVQAVAQALTPGRPPGPSVISRVLALLTRIRRRVVAALREALAAWDGSSLRRVLRDLTRVLRGQIPTWPETRELTGGEPDGLPARVDYWRGLMPAPGRFGQHEARGRWFNKLTLAGLRSGRTLRADDDTRWVTDTAADGGPGATGAAHLDALRGAGRAVDDDVTQRLRRGGLGDDPHAAVTAARARADDAEREWRDRAATGRRGAGAAEKRAWQARRDADDLTGRYATAMATAVRDALAETREMGPSGRERLNISGQPDAVAGLRWAEGFLPTDWITAAKARSIITRTDKSGWYDPHTDMIGLGRMDGAPAGGYGKVAIHELMHFIESAVSEVRAAEAAYYYTRTSDGAVGARRRDGRNAHIGLSDVFPGHGHGEGDVTREDTFTDPYVGREYAEGGLFEMLSTAMESLFAGSAYLDDDLRRFALGVLATIGRPPVEGRE